MVREEVMEVLEERIEVLEEVMEALEERKEALEEVMEALEETIEELGKEFLEAERLETAAVFGRDMATVATDRTKTTDSLVSCNRC